MLFETFRCFFTEVWCIVWLWPWQRSALSERPPFFVCLSPAYSLLTFTQVQRPCCLAIISRSPQLSLYTVWPSSSWFFFFLSSPRPLTEKMTPSRTELWAEIPRMSSTSLRRKFRHCLNSDTTCTAVKFVGVIEFICPFFFCKDICQTLTFVQVFVEVFDQQDKDFVDSLISFMINLIELMIWETQTTGHLGYGSLW